MTCMVGQGLSKFIPWPAAFLIGGATASFTHQTILVAHDNTLRMIDLAVSALRAVTTETTATTGTNASTGTTATATGQQQEEKPPTDLADLIDAMMAPPAATTAAPTPVKKAAVIVRTDPIPNEVLLTRPKRRLGMCPIHNDTEYDPVDTVAMLDRDPEKIVTPPDAPLVRKFDMPSYELLRDVRNDDPEVKQLLPEDLLPRPNVIEAVIAKLSDGTPPVFTTPGIPPRFEGLLTRAM